MANVMSELERDPSKTGRLLRCCNDLTEQIFLANQGLIGQHLDRESTFWAVFDSAMDAVNACSELFLSFKSRDWHPDRDLFRCALVTGELDEEDGVTTGEPLLTALVLNKQLHPGQIVVSEVTKLLVYPKLVEDVRLIGIGAHHLEDASGAQTLFQMTHPSFKRDYPPLPTLLAKPSSLPRMPKSFVGREYEIEQIFEKFWVAPVVVLSGFGGIGKSMLALRVAEELGEKHYHGAVYVDLSGASAIDAAERALARALEVIEEEGSLSDALVRYLKSREVFILVDGCDSDEARAGVETLVNQIVRECHHVQVLLTSRQRLRIEHSTHFHARTCHEPAIFGTARGGEVAVSQGPCSRRS